MCQHPGCNALSLNGYCGQHQKDRQVYDINRGSAHSRGYDNRWKRERKLFLLHNPICVRCEIDGALEPAAVVDHIQPHKGDKILFWDVSNWQALCKHCHDKKTANEDGGFGKKF